MLKYVFKDARTNKHKRLRESLFVLTIISLVLNPLTTALNSYKKDQQTVKDKQELLNQIGALTNRLSKSDGKIDTLYQAISTNTTIPATTRLNLLTNELKNLSRDAEELHKNHELSNSIAMDMKTLRAERDRDLAIQDNQKQQEARQRDIEDIQKQRAEEEAKKRAEQAVKDQQWADEELEKSKKILARQILPMFDYAIQELNKLVADAAKEAGQKPFTDFSGDTPTIYASALVKDGLIVNGTNTISVGTNENSAWNFKVSTSVGPLHANPDFPPSWLTVDNSYIKPRISIQFREPYVSINIASQNTNAESILTITPYREWNSDMGTEPAPTADRPFYSQISIKLNVPNGLNIDELQPSENYKTAIDKALKRFIGAQDQQFPLNMNTNQ